MNSFLQTTEWLEFQKQAGHKVWRFEDGPVRGKMPQSAASADKPLAHRTSNGIKANIIKLGLPMGKSMLYIPHGPEVDFNQITGGIKNELNNFISYLKDLAKEEGSIFIKIEPATDAVMELIYVRGMKRSSKQIQPYKTVILNLDLPEAELLSKMHSKTRYNIKVAEKNGITVKASEDINEFWKLLKKTTKRDRFASHPKEYYEKLLQLEGQLKTNLFLAYKDNKPVAGAIVLKHGNVGYYLHGASDYEHRSLMAPYALHWEIIKRLKSDGAEHYDFWGIDSKKWPGVTRFKLGWGGDQKEYPGSFDLVISRLWYLSYALARKIL